MLFKVVQRSALIALLALGSLGSVLSQKQNEDYKTSTQSGSGKHGSSQSRLSAVDESFGTSGELVLADELFESTGEN
jgi:hypothetical protein